MTIPNMATTSKTAGEILSVRLKSLIGESNLRGAPMRIEKEASRRNLSITHSTLQRMLTGEGAHLDKLEDVAAYFGVGVWELLHSDSAARSAPTLAQALEVVAGALSNADIPTRDLAASMLGNLARNPENHARVAIGLLAMLGNGGPQYETRADTVVQGHDK